MPVTNESYITDYEEWFEFSDENRIRELAYTDEVAVDPMTDPIIGEALDRLHRALNWGRQQIDNFLRNLYDLSKTKGLVDVVDDTTPGEAVKTKNAMLAEFHLSRKRLELEDALKVWRMLKEDLKDLARANADEILGDALRSDQTFPVGTAHEVSRAGRQRVSIFDAIGGAPWVDSSYNEERTRD
jgi:hypothetical protein